MRIVSWNCHMGLQRKFDRVWELAPDVLVVQESASPERLAQRGLDLPGQALWVGDNPDKGLLVVARAGLSLTIDPSHDDGIHHVLPVHVAGEGSELVLLATWNMHLRRQVNDAARREGALPPALRAYRHLLKPGNAVMIGDFNSSVVWDRPTQPWNFGRMIAGLAELGYVSAYHHLTGEEQGQETCKTYFHQFGERWPHYIDYAFVPPQLLVDLQLGKCSEWVQTRLSDHVPLVLSVQQEHAL